MAKSDLLIWILTERRKRLANWKHPVTEAESDIRSLLTDALAGVDHGLSLDQLVAVLDKQMAKDAAAYAAKQNKQTNRKETPNDY
jgi:hypothetical protein